MIKDYTKNNYSIIEPNVITGTSTNPFSNITSISENPISNMIIKDSDLKSNINIKYNANTNTEMIFLTPDSFKIKKVKFNGPATIVFWESGDKTVVKMQKSESKDDREKAIFAAFTKKALSLSSTNSGKEKSIEYIIQKCMKDFVEKIDDNIEKKDE